MANNIAVSITADVADLQVKRAIMSAELKAATKDLNAFAKEAASTGSTDALRAGMLASAEAAEKARVNIAKVNAELKATAAEAIPATEHITHGFESVSVAVGEMGVHLRETVGVIGEMREAMMAFAEAAIAAFALEQIAEFAKKMGETAEQTAHLGEQFGMTTNEVQQLQGVATATGVPLDAITKGMGLLDKNAVAAASGTGTASIAFKAMGISADDGRSQMERMFTVADKFKDMADGPNKVALAMALFGRSGRELIPVLDKGSEGLQEIIKKTEEYGAVNQEAIDRGVKLAESVNESSLAMSGLYNVMTDALAPVLKRAVEGITEMVAGFINSYREGGIVKTLMSGLVVTFEAIGIAVKAASTVFQAIGSAVALVAQNIAALIPVAAGIAGFFITDYVAAAVAATVATIAQSTAMLGLVAAFEIDGIVGVLAVAFDTLTAALGAARLAVMELTTALLANPLGLIVGAVAAVVAAYEELSLTTNKLITKDEQLIKAEETLKDLLADPNSTKEAIKQAEDLIKARVDQAQKDLNTAKAELDLASAQVTQAEANEAANQEWVEGVKQLSAYDGAADVAKQHVIDLTNKIKELRAAIAGGNADIAQADARLANPKTEGPNLAKPAKEKKAGKATKDDTVSKLQEELDAKKTAWDAEQVAQDQAQTFSLQSEAKFWDDALKKAGLSQDAKQAILAKSVEAHQKMIAQQLADEEKGYADQIAAAGKNTDAKMAIATQELAFVAQKFGEQSAQYKKVQDEIVKIKREAQQQIEQVSFIQSQSEIKAAQDTVAQNERAAKFRVQMGIETNAQMFAQDLQFLAQKKAIDDAALANEITAAAQDPVRLAVLNAQKLNLDHQYQAQKTQIEQQATLERTLIQRNAITSISQQWSQSLAGMLTLQQGFASGIGNMWKSLVGSITTMLAQMLEQYLAKFITTEAIKLGILKASQVSTVAGEVAKAGAGGAASMAAAPFPLNLGAPAFAAEMAGLAGSFAAFSAEGGMGTVPYDNAPFLLHKNEMVLPASLASPFRSMLTSNDNMPSAANSNGGGMQNHFHIHALDGQSVKRMFMDNNGHIADALRKYTRDGGR